MLIAIYTNTMFIFLSVLLLFQLTYVECANDTLVPPSNTTVHTSENGFTSLLNETQIIKLMEGSAGKHDSLIEVPPATSSSVTNSSLLVGRPLKHPKTVPKKEAKFTEIPVSEEQEETIESYHKPTENATLNKTMIVTNSSVLEPDFINRSVTQKSPMINSTVDNNNTDILNTTHVIPLTKLPITSTKPTFTTKQTTTTMSSTTTTTTTTTPKPKKPVITHSLEEDPNLPAFDPNITTKQSFKPKSVNPQPKADEKVSETIHSHVLKAQNRQEYIIPVIITIFAVPLFVAFTVYFVRKGKDFWEKRHYRRMDFLIDGIYND